MISIGYLDAYNEIAGDIGYNIEFSIAALAIISNLDEINTENGSIQSGNTTATQNMPDIIAKTLNNVEYCLKNFLTTFLTIEQQDCYLNGACVLDEIVSRELLIFYNALQKIKIYIESINGILKSNPVIDSIRLSTNSNEYTLTTDEFDEDTTNVGNSSNFTYYTVMQGDTARIIAQKELSDQAKFTTILRLNNITEDDFIENNLIGEKIKIPSEIESVSRGDDNLIYESNTENIDSFLFGTDIDLINKKIKISSKGDILSISGVENAIQSIENRLNIKKGSINVFNPNFGTINLGEGNAPLLVKIDRFLNDQQTQIQRDPRVESVQTNLNKLNFNGTSLSVPMKIFFVGVEEPKEVMING